MLPIASLTKPLVGPNVNGFILPAVLTILLASGLWNGVRYCRSKKLDPSTYRQLVYLFAAIDLIVVVMVFMVNKNIALIHLLLAVVIDLIQEFTFIMFSTRKGSNAG